MIKKYRRSYNESKTSKIIPIKFKQGNMFIIALEGLDNSGKTTQAYLLEQKLTAIGRKVIVSKELTTEIGLLLKKGFKSDKFSPIMKTLLFSADRQERIEQFNFIPLEKNCLVIFDRYIHSALAYRQGDGIEVDWVLSVNKNAPPINLGFYIDITSKESIKRNTVKKDNIVYSKDYLEKVRSNYLNYVNKGELKLIDGMRNPEDILTEIFEIIKEKVKKDIHK